MFFCLFEHISYSRGTNTHEHFDEIRTGNTEKRNFRFTGNCTRQQRLTRSRITAHQYATRNAATQFLKPGRISQEFYQFGNFFLGFLTTSHVRKGHIVIFMIKHSGLAFPKRESTTAATASLHLAHEKDPDSNQQQHREP